MTDLIEPTEKTKQEIYRFYLQIYDSEFNQAKKNNLMTGALGYESWSWRVVAITHNAITSIAQNNFKYTAGLQRDHLKKSRAETYRIIFSTKLEFGDWWRIVWDNDETILMTKSEHTTKKISLSYDIDYRLGFFRDAAGPGYLYAKRREGEFIRKLCETYEIR